MGFSTCFVRMCLMFELFVSVSDKFLECLKSGHFYSTFDTLYVWKPNKRPDFKLMHNYLHIFSKKLTIIIYFVHDEVHLLFRHFSKCLKSEPDLFIYFQAEDTNTKTASIDILLFFVEFSPSLVREYMLQQLNSTEDVS